MSGFEELGFLALKRKCKELGASNEQLRHLGRNAGEMGKSVALTLAYELSGGSPPESAASPRRPPSVLSSADIGLLFEILSIALVYSRLSDSTAAYVFMFFMGLLGFTLLLCFCLVPQKGVGPVLQMMAPSSLSPLTHILIIITTLMMFHGVSIFAHYLVFAYELLTQ